MKLFELKEDQQSELELTIQNNCLHFLSESGGEEMWRGMEGVDGLKLGMIDDKYYMWGH